MADQKRPDETPEPDPDQNSWIDKLAQRSTGLPQPDRLPQGSPDARQKSPWAFAGMGLQFAGTTGIFALTGWYLDKRFGWFPWGIVGLTMVGLIGGFYLLVKEALKQDPDKPNPKPPEKPSG